MFTAAAVIYCLNDQNQIKLNIKYIFIMQTLSIMTLFKTFNLSLCQSITSKCIYTPTIN